MFVHPSGISVTFLLKWQSRKCVMNFEIFLAIGMFTAIVLALVAMILVARARLVSDGDVTININGERTITVPAGGKLLQTLAGNNIFLSSACGGGGSL